MLRALMMSITILLIYAVAQVNVVSAAWLSIAKDWLRHFEHAKEKSFCSRERTSKCIYGIMV